MFLKIQNVTTWSVFQNQVTYVNCYVHTYLVCILNAQVARIDFQFGIQYAYVLMIFAMVITLSVTCPIAAPFGM